MASLSRDVKNTFNFLRWRRAAEGATLADLPICDLNPIELVLPAPSNLVATAFSAARINLSWDDNSSSEVEFQIERSLTGGDAGFVQIATVGANVTTYQDSGLSPETTYYYRVRAVSVSLTSAYSNEANATTFDAFAFDVQTANAGVSLGNEFMLPLFNGGNYNFVVEWGDGNFDTITAYNQAEIIHSYSASGAYTILISGTCVGFSFNNGGDAQKMFDISKWGVLQRTPTQNGDFYGCSNLSVSATDILDTSGNSNFQSMFRDCVSITTIPSIESWDASLVTVFNSMFNGCTNFTQTMDGLTIPSLPNMQMSNMFENCVNFNQPLNSWNVSTVIAMGNMFRGCSTFNQDLNNWNVSQVTNMGFMFTGCVNFNGNVDTWVPSVLTNMLFLFDGCTNFDRDIGSWDVSQVTNMFRSFRGCINFNRDLTNWNLSSIQNMVSTFSGCTAFAGDVSGWTLNNTDPINLNATFLNCPNFNSNVSGWNVSQVTITAALFEGCSSFNQNLSSWNTANLVDAGAMLRNCVAFNSPIFTNTPLLEDAASMLLGCTNFNQNSLASWNVTSLLDASGVLSNTSFSTANYDALLIAWEAQAVQTGASLGVGSTQYTLGGAAETARTNLINAPNNWTITDGGGV